MSDGGFYLMHRGWQDNPVFRNEAFSRRDAFVWLIEEAAYRSSRVHVSGGAITLNRGQLSHSLRFMAKAWKWDEAKVRRFLSSLVKEKIIDAATDAGQTVVTICNYEKYQSVGGKTDAANDAAPTQQRRGGDAKKKEGKEGKEEEESADALPGKCAGDDEKELGGQGEGGGQPDGDDDEPVLKAEHVVEAWNTMANRHGLPKVTKLTETRKRQLAARLRQHPIDDFAKAIGAIERSPFLLGDSKGGWRADFDFFLQPSSFVKLVEGSYDRAN